MAGFTDLEMMLAALEPDLREGEFVYACVSEEAVGHLPVQAMVRESEGVTVVLRREDADEAGLTYDFVAGWISLKVHSSLNAVGLTAAFASALCDAGVSCNVLAGFHHDHILVPIQQASDALQILQGMSARPPM